MVLWRPTRPSRTNTQRCPFHYRGLECTSRNLRHTWTTWQICPWSTRWSRSKVNRVLPRERTGHRKHPLPTTQEKTLHMDITRRSTPKSGCIIKEYNFFGATDGEALYSQQKQDRELTKIMNSLLPNSDLNWRKYRNTRPFRKDLNQIPHDYTVEVRNRLK